MKRFYIIMPSFSESKSSHNVAYPIQPDPAAIYCSRIVEPVPMSRLDRKRMLSHQVKEVQLKSLSFITLTG